MEAWGVHRSASNCEPWRGLPPPSRFIVAFSERMCKYLFASDCGNILTFRAVVVIELYGQLAPPLKLAAATGRDSQRRPCFREKTRVGKLSTFRRTTLNAGPSGFNCVRLRVLD